jgi:hypothetical protein
MLSFLAGFTANCFVTWINDHEMLLIAFTVTLVLLELGYTNQTIE